MGYLELPQGVKLKFLLFELKFPLLDFVPEQTLETLTALKTR